MYPITYGAEHIYPTCRAYRKDVHDHHMNQVYTIPDVKFYLDKYLSLKWYRSGFNLAIKYDYQWVWFLMNELIPLVIVVGSRAALLHHRYRLLSTKMGCWNLDATSKLAWSFMGCMCQDTMACSCPRESHGCSTWIFALLGRGNQLGPVGAMLRDIKIRTIL
jgi:hypothetical protein